jgi:hypothetical protein
MALQHLRSSTADKRPTPAAMAEGQLALNSAAVSPGLFFKNASGALVKVGPVHVGTTAPNATPASGGEAGNSVGEQWLDTSGTNPVLKIWDGSTWASEAGEFVNASGDTMTGALVMDNQQQVRFRETTANGTNYIALQAPASVSSDKTITLPDVTGTVVTTGDTGTVTSTMILDGTIVNADISASAAIVDTKLDTIATAGKVSNSATTATNANTASAIVARDGSGNFSAGTITAALTGAASANVLKAGDTMTGVLAVTAGTAALPAITPSGDPNTGIYSPDADQLAISTNGSERLRILSDGKLGLGTSSPGAKLHVVDTDLASTYLTLATADSPTVSFVNQATNVYARIAGGNYATASSVNLDLSSNRAKNKDIQGGWRLKSLTSATASSATGSNFQIVPTTYTSSNTITEGTAALTINNSGLVGIGTTSPNKTLTVVGDVLALGLSSNGNLEFNCDDNANNAGNDAIIFKERGTEKMRMDGSGRLLVGTSSDSGGALLQVNGDRVRIATAKTPASASATGTAGEICWDADYIYVCTATNTWKRTAISTWP